MDFGTLLYAAQANEHKAKKESKKCYTTSFSAPKKEQKSNRNLSANIQKFLARKDEEEKRKEQEAKKKRDELLALRSQDGKAKKRVAAMLKRTKAANKSAIEDAVDDDNTAVTLDGPSQPDEDDYGYVSQEASAYYNKLMDKYNSAPVEEPLFSEKKKAVHKDLTSTKDRVRMALQKEEEEEMMPHKRKRKSKIRKEEDLGDTTISYQSSDLRDLYNDAELESDPEPEPEPEKPKPKFKRPAAPPPLNFHDLLKLAEKKQFEPIKIEPKKKPEDDEHRPMTKKQKIEYMKEQEWRQRKEEAAKAGQTSLKIPKIQRREDSEQHEKHGTIDKGQSMRIPKISSAMRVEKTVAHPKEEQRYANNFKKEERMVSTMKRPDNVGPPRQNGGLSRENSYSAPLKASISSKDDGMLKKMSRDSDAIPKKQRSDSDNNLIHKYQSYEDGERSRGIKNDHLKSSSSTFQRQSFNSSEVKQKYNNNVDVIKNSSSSSGYDKKLQEAIMAKMQESQKKKILNESESSKPAGKSFSERDISKVTKEIETSSPSMKAPPGKLPPRPDRPRPVEVPRRPDRPRPIEVPPRPDRPRPVEVSPRPDRPRPVEVSPRFDRPRPVEVSSRPDRPRPVEVSPRPDRPRPVEVPARPDRPRPVEVPPRPDRPRPVEVPPRPDRPRPVEVPPRPVRPRPVELPPRPDHPRPVELPPRPDRPRPVELPPRPDRPRPVEQKSNSLGQKPNSRLDNRQSQEWNSQNRPSNVPSAKPRVPPNEKPRAVPSSTPRPSAVGDDRTKPVPQSSSQGRSALAANGQKPMPPHPNARPKQLPPGVRPKQAPSDACLKKIPPGNVKPSQFSRGDMQPREFPPPDVRRKQFPPPDVRKTLKSAPKRRITDSDEEHDSEMDDFIDDGPEEEEDYSQHIREIFGYDRRKYSRIQDDDEDECMESNFATILKEDYISTKTGILEDLEDIRREKEMEKRKKMTKKKTLK